MEKILSAELEQGKGEMTQGHRGRSQRDVGNCSPTTTQSAFCWQSRNSAFPPAVLGLQYKPLDAERCWKSSLHPGFGAINLNLTEWQSAVLWNSAKQTRGTAPSWMRCGRRKVGRGAGRLRGTSG